MKVFLGGTCNGYDWRKDLIPKLKVDYFNPLVEDWTPECIEEEERQKWQECDVYLYHITPDHYGFYTFVEVMDSVFENDDTIFCFAEGFDEAKKRSLSAIGKKVQEHKGIWLNDNEDGFISSLSKIAHFMI